MDDLEQERRARSRLLMPAAVVGAIIFVAGLGWALMPDKLGVPSGGQSASSNGEMGRDKPAQNMAQSRLGREDPAGLEDPSGGRARALKATSEPLEISTTQLSQLKDILQRQGALPQTDKAVGLMIGEAIPTQVPVSDLPAEIPQLLNGYWGDQYTVAKDKLLIVDQHTRRVVAIVSGVV